MNYIENLLTSPLNNILIKIHVLYNSNKIRVINNHNKFTRLKFIVFIAIKKYFNSQYNYYNLF